MQPLPAKSSVPAIVAASLAAIGASVCCVVPLVLVLLGISGAWIANLTALDAWRPWFSGATLLALAVAFYALYGPATRCGDGACIEPTLLARRRRLLWIATLVIVLLLLFPYYVAWFLPE